MREQAILAAAMSAMRDGDDILRRDSAEWAQGVFAQALSQQVDHVHRVRGGLRYNPPAIAFVGIVHAVKHGVTTLTSGTCLTLRLAVTRLQHMVFVRLPQ